MVQNFIRIFFSICFLFWFNFKYCNKRTTIVKQNFIQRDSLTKSGYFSFVDKTPINRNLNPNVENLKYIVIHTTGDYSTKRNNDNYEANRIFFKHYADTVNRIASWHFTVDETGISQLISLNQRGYHASNKKINNSSIGIELCVNHYKDPTQFKKAIENEKFLIKEILKIYTNLILIRHHDADDKNHKNCPQIFTDNQWIQFKNYIINDETLNESFFNDYTKLKSEYRNGKYVEND